MSVELKSLNIKVEVYGGVDLHEAIKDMVAMARHIRCDVWANLNGVNVLARPTDEPEEVWDAYENARELQRSHAATR